MLAVVLTAVAALYLLALGAYFLALAHGRARAGLPGLARELTPYLLAPAVLLAAAGVLLRAPAVLAPALLSLAAVAVALKPVWPGRRRSGHAPATPTRFRILTLNAGGNAGAPEASKVERTVATMDADIVAIQELTPETLPGLRDSLAGRYPYSHGGWPAIVFSRLPIRAGCSLRFPTRGSDAQRVEIDVGGRTLVLFNVHITRPGHELDGRLARFRLVLDYDPTTRDADAALVHEQAGPSPTACVVAGDLNATEWSHPYRLLTTTLVDAFRETAWGWGNTYRLNLWRERGRRLRIPVARIDYLFHSPDLVALEARTGLDSGSDHLPVVADLAFR